MRRRLNSVNVISSSIRKARARTAQATTVANAFIVDNNSKFEAAFRRLFPRTMAAMQSWDESGAKWSIGNEGTKYGISPGMLNIYKRFFKYSYTKIRKLNATEQRQQYLKKVMLRQLPRAAKYHRTVSTSVWKRKYAKPWKRHPYAYDAAQRARDEGPDGFFGKARIAKQQQVSAILASRPRAEKRGRGPNDMGSDYFTVDGRQYSYEDGTPLDGLGTSP